MSDETKVETATAPRQRGGRGKRGGKKSGKPDVRAKRGGKTAAAPKRAKETTSEFNREAEEKALIAKYPDQRIVKGSLQDVAGKGEFAQKRSIEIECQRCHDEKKEKTVRRIATSDLHQVKNCDPCVKEIRLERRKEARAAARAQKGLPPLGAKKEAKDGE
jgi:hypothetical protein